MTLQRRHTRKYFLGFVRLSVKIEQLTLIFLILCIVLHVFLNFYIHFK